MTTPCNQIFEPLCVGYVGITYLHLQNFWALPLLFHKPFGGPETTSKGLGEELRNGSLPFAHTESLKGVSSFSGKLLSCPQIKQVEITLLLHRWLIGNVKKEEKWREALLPALMMEKQSHTLEHKGITTVTQTTQRCLFQTRGEELPPTHQPARLWRSQTLSHGRRQLHYEALPSALSLRLRHAHEQMPALSPNALWT